MRKFIAICFDMKLDIRRKMFYLQHFAWINFYNIRVFITFCGTGKGGQAGSQNPRSP